MTGTSGTRVLIATALVCAVLGSIHSFSVFLIPLETALGQSRAAISLTYSFALVSITLMVLFGPKLYAAMQPGRILVLAGVFGAVGTVIAGFADGMFGIWFGYSICFGLANGLGYGFSLQYAAHANPTRPGAAMGVVTAAYASGAAVAPAIFTRALDHSGFLAAMVILAIALLVATLVAGWIITRAGVAYAKSSATGTSKFLSTTSIAKIWVAYGAGVAAGLMAIGHAAGIANAALITPWHAPAVLAICNLFGSLASGHMVDRHSHPAILTTLPLLSVVGLVALALAPPLTLPALGLIGFAYGGTIAAYPAVISNWFPGATGALIYGRVFTAWGSAGLIAPWLAGYLYDQSQSYAAALWIATALAAGSAGLAVRVLRFTGD